MSVAAATAPAMRAAKPAVHPKYTAMVAAAIASLKERSGSSRQAILNYIMAYYKVGNETAKVNARVKTALKSGVTAGTLKQTKGTGATGSFRLVAEKKVAAKPKPKKVTKPKPVTTQKHKSPKKKVAAKKPKSMTPTKKAAAAKAKQVKTQKKAATAKPKKAKSPVKRAAATKPKQPKKAVTKKADKQ